MSYGQNSNLKISISNSNPFLNLKWTETNIKSNLIGEYQFYNISLAICIGVFFKVSIHKIKRAIESYIPKNNRSEITKTDNNTIILDAYNANPSSMKAMLDYFANQKSTNKLCILGDMLEMGKYSMQEHTKIIKICNELKLEVLFVGEEFSKLSNKAFKKLVDIKSYIKKNPIKNKNILLKGSRGVKLEELVDYL
jgi:UDP-N-acetylmuramoyl-tripeptide--D-alanyl-D-alanine ligase